MRALLGRKKERRVLEEALSRPGARVALFGPGGAGKTRLVDEVVLRRVHADLSRCRTEEDLLEAIASALGVPLVGDRDVERLASAAARIEAPMVFDCCEAVLEPLLGVLARFPSTISIVLTTRIRPHGWPAIELGPLGLPASDDLDAVACSEAGELFFQTARYRRPSWRPSEAEGPLIADLLRRLNGLPLAVELAASRLRVLGTRQLLDHLDQRFDLLKNGETSLRAVLESSWSLLTEREEHLLRQLAWFRGGFDLAAVQDLDGISDPLDALDQLETLVDRSLVRSWELPRVPGDRWYALYDSVREFALERGEALSRGPWLARHGYALARASYGPDHLLSMERLSVYAPDLRATFRAAIEAEDADTAAYSVLALDALLRTRGPGTARRELFEEARTLATGSMSDELLLAGMDARIYPIDEGRIEGIAERARASGDGRVLGWSMRTIAREQAAAGALETALEYATASVEAEPDEPRNLATIAEVHAAAGNRVESVRAYHRALAAAQERGAKRDEAAILGFLAMAEHELGRSEEASAVCTRAISLLDGLQDTRRAAIYAQLLGEIALMTRDLEEADRAFEEAAERLTDVGETRWVSYCIAGRGMVQALRGDTETAFRRFQAAMREAREHDSARVRGVVACWAATASSAADRIEAAEGWLETIDDDSPKVRHGRWVAERALALARARALRDSGDASAASSLESEVIAQVQRVDRTQWTAEVKIPGRWLDEQVETLAKPQRVDLTIGPEHRYFELPGGKRQSLATRHANRRVLVRLLQAHREGRSATVVQLLESGWPGERVVPDAGSARVYTAIATLRRWGLKGLIEKAEGGYRFKPDCIIVEE